MYMYVHLLFLCRNNTRVIKCIHMYIHIYICKYVYINTYICKYVYMYISVYTYVDTCMSTTGEREGGESE